MSRDEKKRVMVTLSKEVADDFDELAKKMGLSKSGLVTIWVNENKKEKKKAKPACYARKIRCKGDYMTKRRKDKDERTRNWTFVVYPESAPEDWREIIDDLHVPWIESPLHDKDVNPDGEIKKPHWHV